MAGFQELRSGRSGVGSGFGENLFCYTPDETNGVSNAASCCKEAVQFSASCFVTSLFANFRRNLQNGNEFCIFINRVTLIVKTPTTGQLCQFYPQLTVSILQLHQRPPICTKSGYKFGRSRTWPDLREMAGFWICRSRIPVPHNPNDNISHCVWTKSGLQNKWL